MGNNMFFRMNDFSAVDDVQGDFQHEVDGLIDKFGAMEGFPKLADYGSDKGKLDDYLFNKQAILDSEGTERSRYTLAGILVILPVVVVAAFPEDTLPWGKYSVFLAVAAGLLLYLTVSFIRKFIIKRRLVSLDRECPSESRYVGDVISFAKNINDNK